jgi:hypothetical protein
VTAATAGHTYGPGTLAVIDTFGGLVPCRVEAVTDDGRVTVRVTAARPGWRRGELPTLAPWDVVPRDMIRRRGGRLRIRTDYAWKPAGA